MSKPITVTLPGRGMVALCGTAGSGKSTFAVKAAKANGLPATAIVSSDAFRLMLCDNPHSILAPEQMEVQHDTFALFNRVIETRMRLGKPIIADTVNLWPAAMFPNAHRGVLLDLAARYAYPTALVVFDVPLDVCVARNNERPESQRAPAQFLAFQRQQLDLALGVVDGEGWGQTLVSADPLSGVRVVFSER